MTAGFVAAWNAAASESRCSIGTDDRRRGVEEPASCGGAGRPMARAGTRRGGIPRR